jgi:hypothetical protein
MLVGEMDGPFADVCPIKILATGSAMFVVTDADNTTSSRYRSARRLAKPVRPLGRKTEQHRKQGKSIPSETTKRRDYSHS